MAGATIDMITSGPSAGTIIRPPAYTTSEDETTRVVVFLRLATPAGAYVYKTSEGLDHEAMLSPDTSDEERAELVRDVLLSTPRVTEVGEIIVTRDEGAEAPRVNVSAEYTTETGAQLLVGFTI